MLVIAAVMWVVLHRSVFGRHLYAVGKNEEAARYSGIRTTRVIVAAYVICDVLAALSSIFFAMYTRSILPSGHGNFYELYAIAAAVLGGFSLRGGEGSIVGVVLGTILLQVLQNLVNLLGIPSSLNFAVMGSVILIGVIADQQFALFRKRREITRQRMAASRAHGRTGGVSELYGRDAEMLRRRHGDRGVLSARARRQAWCQMRRSLIKPLVDAMRSRRLSLKSTPTIMRGPCVLAPAVRWRSERRCMCCGAIPKGRSRPAVLVTAYRPEASRWDASYARAAMTRKMTITKASTR